jgi:hypothetical protein
MVQPVFYSAKRLILSDDFCRAYGIPAKRTQAPPAPPSRASRTPAGNYRPFRLARYSNRVRLNPDLPLTRLPVHNSQTVFTLFPFFT